MNSGNIFSRIANLISGQIGYDPTHNQAEWGTPRASAYGWEARATPPMMIVDYYPTFPYLGNQNYNGLQIYANSITESLLAYTHGYRGIEPLTRQPLANQPYPYQENLLLTGQVY